MKSTSVPKMFNWGLRFLELIIAIILVGNTAYFINQWNKYADIEPPASLVVTLIASVFALAFALIYLIGVILSGVFHGISAAIDFVVFTLYLTSIGLLAENYNSNRSNRPLVRNITSFRVASNLSAERSLVQNMVSLLDGLVIVQIVLYFCSMLLSTWVAWKETRYTKEQLRLARSAADHDDDTRPAMTST